MGWLEERGLPQPRHRPQRADGAGDGRLRLHRRDVGRRGARGVHLRLQAQRRRQGAHLPAPLVGALLGLDTVIMHSVRALLPRRRVSLAERAVMVAIWPGTWLVWG